MEFRPQVSVRWYGDVAVVCAPGALADTWPQVRRELQFVLSSQPMAVLVDLTEGVDDRGTELEAALTELEWHAQAWSGVAIVACGPHQAIRDSARGALLAAPTLEAALASLRGRAAPEQIRVELPPDPRSAADARQVAQHATLLWDAQSDDVAILVSELVTNAVVHAHGWIELSVSRYDRELRIAVRDGSPNSPEARAMADDGLGGRGLGLVQALSHAWGTLPTRDGGKVVWCTLHTSSVAT